MPWLNVNEVWKEALERKLSEKVYFQGDGSVPKAA